MEGSDDFVGPREVWSAPRIEKVRNDLGVAIRAAQELMASHEPIIKETYEALTELGDRVVEAVEVYDDIVRLEKEENQDQEEVNSILKGALKTRIALLETYLRAKTEIEK